MNKIILYLFFTLISYQCFYAQSSGFMGKHMVISYGFHASPAIIGATKNNETLFGDIINEQGNAETGVITFNNLHEISLDFVASSKWLICLNVKYYKTAFDNAEICESGNRNSTNYYSGNPEGFYSIRGLTYGLTFKYFGKRYIAPWGRYLMFGPVINTVKTSYDKNMVIKGAYYPSAGPTNFTITDFGPKNQNFAGFNFMLGWGKSRIFANNIIVDFGASTQIFALLSIPKDILGVNFNEFDKYPTKETYIEDTYKKRVRGINRFNIFLKIGYLF